MPLFEHILPQFWHILPHITLLSCHCPLFLCGMRFVPRYHDVIWFVWISPIRLHNNMMATTAWKRSYAARIRLICLKLGKLLYNHFVGISFTYFELGRLLRSRAEGIRLICLWHGRCSAVVLWKYVIFLELGRMFRSCAAKVSLVVYNLAGRSTAVLRELVWFD